jgi:hypothetical protein
MALREATKRLSVALEGNALSLSRAFSAAPGLRDMHPVADAHRVSGQKVLDVSELAGVLP